jgi:5-oxoprolinase (ATP-hydrolysing) subunit A
MSTAATLSVDLNSDLGEGFGPWTMGDDAAMLDIVTSANIACGGHAGDPETMFKTLRMAAERSINVGAHPSYPDKEGFGRRHMPYSPAEIERFVAAQLGALMALAALAGTSVRYVKPHGALGNAATEDHDIAGAIIRAVRAVDSDLAVLAISGTVLEQIVDKAGMRAFSEVFADRGYTVAGNLVPRGQPGAMIHDAKVATERILAFLETGHMPTADGGQVKLRCHSICIHGDSDDAVIMARHMRDGLLGRGFRIEPFWAMV